MKLPQKLQMGNAGKNLCLANTTWGTVSAYVGKRGLRRFYVPRMYGKMRLQFRFTDVVRIWANGLIKIDL